MQRVHLVVTGRVQGVGYRWYVLRRAQALGLGGEVRNRRDGAVLIDAEGPRAGLEELVELAREGPPASIVTAVDVSWSEGPRRWRAFEVGPTS
jgi:acylphosphatase